VTEKTAELEALLYLFEKHFDVPAATIAIEIAYGTRTPLHVVLDPGDPPDAALPTPS
jgi:hypothetical protein